ncbi:MAG TPA: hypothetical protein VFB25_04070 [Gaiellaceae bacterium]|nr:hypothetical protein [Gaiellaceae bacterium]
MAVLVTWGAVGAVLGTLVTVALTKLPAPGRRVFSAAATIGVPFASERLFRAHFEGDELFGGVAALLVWAAFVAGYWGASILTELARFANARWRRA